jgi:hypothetical protein
MPWLHLIFDAWEDHRRMRDQEEAAHAALAELPAGDDGEPDEDEHREKKKKKKHKDKK